MQMHIYIYYKKGLKIYWCGGGIDKIKNKNFATN